MKTLEKQLIEVGKKALQEFMLEGMYSDQKSAIESFLNPYHYIGWGGTVKRFSCYIDAMMNAKEEGIGSVTIYKGREIVDTIYGFTYS